MKRLPAFTLDAFQQAEQGSYTGFVIQMARLDIAAWCNNRTGVKGDEITDSNTELQHIILGGDKLVDPDFHILLGPFEFTRIGIDMHRRMAG
ncbi:hypothetical protein D3C74_296850 [compost metagenome]